MKILYFAALREALKIADEEIIITSNTNVADLKAILIKKYGNQHFPVNILCAVNHTIADNAQRLNNADEVAFYPPVTGG